MRVSVVLVCHTITVHAIRAHLVGIYFGPCMAAAMNVTGNEPPEEVSWAKRGGLGH